MSAPRLILFDCDGVLVDSERLACSALSACLGRIGVLIPTEEILRRYIGNSAASIYRDIETRFDRKLPGNFADIVQAATLDVFARELCPMPGMLPVLDALRTASCVASSSTPTRIRFSLEKAGLLSHFTDRIFSATQVARGKPAPDLFLFAAQHMGVEAMDCLVVEDSPAGVQAARAAQMRVVAFLGGDHCDADSVTRLQDAGAELLVHHASELPAMFLRAACESPGKA